MKLTAYDGKTTDIGDNSIVPYSYYISNAINIYPAVCVLMAWCFSTPIFQFEH